MLLDFEITNCSRRCSKSGRTLAPGEPYFSSLQFHQGVAVRTDFAAEAWLGPPAGSIAWWKSRMLEDSSKPKLAPQDVLLNLFAELAGSPDEACFRYVLGLLLLRRRIVKLEESLRDPSGETLVLYCPRRDETFELRAAPPDADQVDALQRRIIELLYGGA